MTRTGIILNKEALATSQLRRDALEIIETGIRRVLPDTILHTSVSFERSTRTLSVNNHIFHIAGRLFVIGGGKASGLMAQTLESIIGSDMIDAGIVIDKAPPAEFETSKIQLRRAGHPVPDNRGVEAVRQILSLKNKCSMQKEDLVLCLISGGGSALMPAPLAGLSLNDKQQVTRLLLSCGADIYEINTIRKHLSSIKGGRLAQFFAPTRVISLILSDVIGNDLSVIASGPTYPDPSTYEDAYAVLTNHLLLDIVPDGVLSVLKQGCLGKIEETPKSLDNVENFIIGDNRLALAAMAEKAHHCGFNPLIISSEQKGDTCIVAHQRAREILDGVYAGYNALLMGGETTPALPENHGSGGRNQHYAAVTPLLLESYPRDWVLASVGTDGSDFMPDVAGAVVDRNYLDVFRDKAPDYLERLEKYDSRSLLERAGNSLIITGDTHTNVGDIAVYLLA